MRVVKEKMRVRRTNCFRIQKLLWSRALSFVLESAPPVPRIPTSHHAAAMRAQSEPPRGETAENGFFRNLTDQHGVPQMYLNLSTDFMSSLLH